MNLEVISLDRIEPNPRNPRRTRSQEAIQELADSIKAQGLLQPITVRLFAQAHGKVKALYQIVMGERRYLASKLAGLDEIDCIVRDMTDREVMEAMLVENLQRADVDPIEEARYVSAALMDGWTGAEVAARLGKSAKWVAIRIQIASMAEEILDLVKEEKIGIAHVQMLAQVKDPELRLELATDAAERNWTISDLREAIDEHQRKLADAPWKMNAKLGSNPPLPTCVGCSDRSDKQGDLFGGERHAMCLNGACWRQKLEAHKLALKSKLESDGRKVLGQHERYMAENGYSGYTKDESEIEQLKDQGVKPRVLIGDDGNTTEFWNTNDAPETEVEDTPEDPAEVAKREAKYKEERINDIVKSLVRQAIAKKLENPDETVFFDFLADAINECDCGVESILDLAEQDENDKTKPVRHSENVDFKKLRAAICSWIMDNIEVDDKDLATFKINPKKFLKQAEAQYEQEQAEEEEEE